MNRRKLSAGLVVGAVALLGLGINGGVAQAAPPAPVLPAPSIFTLPLAVPLAVTVTTGPGGAITDVSVGAPVDPNAVVDPNAPVVDPAATPADPLAVTKARPGKVSFVNEADGVKISIRSKGQTQTLTARADSIDAFLANPNGMWSGDVFPGVPGSVAYVVGGDAAAPTLTVGAITGGGVAADPVTKTGEDGEVSVKLVVTFTSPDGAQTRDLSIRLKVENEDESDDDSDSPETHASLSITLGKIRGAVGAAKAGPQSGGAVLCDGTGGTFTYDVAADGTISNVLTFVDAAPVDSKVEVEGTKASIKFPTGERFRINVTVETGGGLTINVGEKIRCRDAAAPTINGDPANVVGGDGGDNHDGDHHGGDHNGGNQNGGDQGGRHGGGGDNSDD